MRDERCEADETTIAASVRVEADGSMFGRPSATAAEAELEAACRAKKSEQRTPAGQDFRIPTEGDADRALCKMVETLVYQNELAIVYLDENLYVEWAEAPNAPHLPKGAGVVLDRLGLLEARPVSFLTSEQIGLFERLLAEAVARTIGDRDPMEGQHALDSAERWIDERSREIARRWYLSASGLAALIPLAVGSLLWAARRRLATWIGCDAVDVLLGACAGGVGALLFILLRSSTLPFDVSAGPLTHYADGVMRIGVGMIGGMVVALAIKANVLLGIVTSSTKPRATLLFVCLAAGASERMVPDLIRHVETLTEKEAGGDKASQSPTPDTGTDEKGQPAQGTDSTRAHSERSGRK